MRGLQRIEGEVTTVQLGVTYRLRFDFNVMVDFEDRTGRNALTALSQENLASLSAADIRLMVYLCLKDHHPELTERDAGRIYSRDVGAFARLMAASFPDATADHDVPVSEDASGNVTAAA